MIIEKEIEIGEVRELLEAGFEIEVASPDGWVRVDNFVDKGEWEEWTLECFGKRIICNQAHLFQTELGWKAAESILEIQQTFGIHLRFLCDDGEYHQGLISKSVGVMTPIVDITVDHPNHRYYTDGISSHNTGVGKSLAMTHMASAALSMGKNVLYVTMEMSEERIAERIDANLFDVPIADLSIITKATFDTKIAKIKSKTNGQLIIKEYPTSSAHSGHFRALLNELRIKKNFTPDLIFIDYLNICASSRMKGMGGSINSYTYIKAIAEELRGLAVEFSVPIWTATQVNREGFGSSDIDLTNTSESFGLPATVDFMVALITNEKLEQQGQILVKQLKNRYNDLAISKKFLIGIDKSKMRLYDVEESAQSSITQEGAMPPGPARGAPIPDKPPFMVTSTSTKPRFSGLTNLR